METYFETAIDCPSCRRSNRPRVIDYFEDIDSDHIYDNETGDGYDLIAEYHLMRCKFCKFVYEMYRDELVEGGDQKSGRWRSVKMLKVNEGTGFGSPILFPVDILDSMVILECDEDIAQGTAFKLNGIGFVTCEHVLGSTTKAFTKANINQKFNVKIAASIKGLDLAILEIPEFDHLRGFDPFWDAELKLLDEIFIAGFPNFRLADTGTIVTSAVSGFRTVSTVRRILTSGPIIGGNSGGPVLLRDGRVIGIAVTGADKMENASKTEDHGIIPIDTVKKVLDEIKRPHGV